MKTTIDLPEALVTEAMRLSHERTKTGVIISALKDYVRKHKIQEVKKFKGRVPLDADLNTLRKRL